MRHDRSRIRLGIAVVVAAIACGLVRAPKAPARPRVCLSPPTPRGVRSTPKGTFERDRLLARAELPHLLRSQELAERATRFVTSQADGRAALRRGLLSGQWIYELARIVDDVTEPAASPYAPPAELLLALSWRESKWQPRARGAGTDRGLCQITDWAPGWSMLDMFDAAENLRLAAALLERDRVKCGDWVGALAKYGRGQCILVEDADLDVFEWASALYPQEDVP